MNIAKLLPNKNILYSFLFSLTLTSLTLIIGDFFINKKLQEIAEKKQEENYITRKKIDFIEKFVIVGQSRIYLAENYYYNYINDENYLYVENSWKDYMVQVKKWNSNNVYNPLFIKFYFGNETQNEFYNGLLPSFVRLHESLLNMKNKQDYEDIELLIEKAKHELFVFSEKMMDNVP